MGAKTGIEWTDATWSPIRYRVREDAADIATLASRLGEFDQGPVPSGRRGVLLQAVWDELPEVRNA